MSRRIARPYAAALFGVVGKRGLEALRAAETELGAVAEVFRREPSLLRVFEVPSVAPARKGELITSVGTALGVSREILRVLQILTEHLRLRALPDVVAMLRELTDRKIGLQRGRVQVPVALSAVQVAALGATMSELLGSRVELEVEVHPELLAGFVVRVGSRVFDGSLDAHLRRFAAGSGDH
jgi:F-type H+-transporting ATPase subunit delta